MKLALQQTAGVPGQPAANLGELRQIAQQAAEEGADLLVLPEMWLTGYNIGDEVWALAEPADGSSADAIADTARDTGVAILYGYPEWSGDAVYNAAQLVDSKGTRRLNVRKTHLFGAEEKRLFKPGESLSKVVELCGVRLAVLICYDVEFPEAVRTLALNRAELILVPTALFEPYRFIAEHVVRVRAWESQLYLAYANRCGREGLLQYVGGSSICAPDGELAARADGEPQRIAATIDTACLERLRCENPYLNDRRAQLYRSE